MPEDDYGCVGLIGAIFIAVGAAALWGKPFGWLALGGCFLIYAFLKYLEDNRG